MVEYLEGEAPGVQDAGRTAADARFIALRRGYALQTVVLVVGFLGWYLGYLLLSVFARDLMAVPVAGAVNVGLLLGIGQFATTFLFARAYVRRAERRLDPLADAVRADALRAEAVRPEPTRAEAVRP